MPYSGWARCKSTEGGTAGVATALANAASSARSHVYVIVPKPSASVSVFDAVSNWSSVGVVSSIVTAPAGASFTLATAAVTAELTLSAVPNMGADVTASAIVRNTGQTRVEDVAARFACGPGWPVAQLGTDQYVSLDPGGSVVLQEPWPAAAQGDNMVVFLMIDPDAKLSSNNP